METQGQSWRKNERVKSFPHWNLERTQRPRNDTFIHLFTIHVTFSSESRWKKQQIPDCFSQFNWNFSTFQTKTRAFTQFNSKSQPKKASYEIFLNRRSKSGGLSSNLKKISSILKRPSFLACRCIIFLSAAVQFSCVCRARHTHTHGWLGWGGLRGQTPPWAVWKECERRVGCWVVGGRRVEVERIRVENVISHKGWRKKKFE